MKILLATDGSESAMRATRRLIETLRHYREPPFIEVLTVHLPVPNVPHLSTIVPKSAIDQYYADESGEMLKPVCSTLDDADIRHQSKARIGAIAENIVAESKDGGFDCIWMGTHGRTAIGNMVLGSTATKVLHLADVPVVMVR